ncbi:unnamed protein product, partial [Didymodactylos carnosus]
MIRNRSLRHHYVYIPESSSKFYTRPPETPTYLHGDARRNTPMGEDGKHRGYRTQRVPLMPLPAGRETGAKLSLEIVADKTGLNHRSSSTIEPVTTMAPLAGKPAYFYVQLLPMKSMKRYETFPLTYVVFTNGKIISAGTFNIEPTKYCTMAPRSIQPEQEDSSKPLR